MALSKLYSKFATDAELLAASGKLQQEINQGGGGSGAPIDETYFVHKTGDETVAGIKNFTSGISGSSFDTIEGVLKSNLVGFDEEFSPIFGDFYTSLDWTFGILYSGDAQSLDWHLRETYTENFETSINWNSRELHASDGRSINWGLRELYTYNGDVAANWDNKALYGFYVEDFVNIIPVETLAWGQRQLLIGEANGFASINWEQGWLMSTGTNSSGAASNHMVANWFEGILYSMRDSHQPEDGEESPFVAHASVDWQNRKLYTVNNFGGEEFPDWQNDLTLDWSGRMFHGEWGFANGSIAAYGNPDEETGERPVEGYLVMPGINGMGFEDADGKLYLSATQRRLVGLGVGGFIETSLHWGNRATFDFSGNQSIDWDDRTLISTVYDADEDFDIPLITLDWRNKQILGNWTSDSGIAGATHITAGSNVTVDGAGTAVDPFIVSAAGGGAGIGPFILNPVNSQVEYNIVTNSSSLVSQGGSGIWVRNTGQGATASAIYNRAPVFGFEYQSKEAGADVPFTGYSTILSAYKLAPFEIYLNWQSGVYQRIFSVGVDSRMPKSTTPPSYFGYTTMTNLGGTRFTSGANGLVFTSPYTGRVIGTLITINDSGYYMANYKVDLNVQPSSFTRNIKFYLEGSGQRLIANAHENQYFLTIPPDTSGRFTAVGNPSLIVHTGGSTALNIMVDYDTEATEQVRMSGFLRLSVQS